MFSSITAGLLLLQLPSLILGCSEHANFQSHPHRGKRQITVDPGRKVLDWAYEASYNWGLVNPAYGLCQNGTNQSPIPLDLSQGVSRNHALNFTGYNGKSTGNFYNWGYGPAFTLHHEEHVYTTLPSVVFDNETVYLTGWHIHAPADHSVGGARAKAELHFVHVNAEGNYRAVVAMRLDPGSTPSPFFSSLPPYIGFNETRQLEGVELDNRQALAEVNMVNEFWTYQGSLTSPPCREGVQWYVARTILFTSDSQMRELLHVSTYSARAEQQVWLHQVNV